MTNKKTAKYLFSFSGWNPWTDWSSCSATCGNGGGYQTRQRVCAKPSSPGTCPTYNVEKRSCNTFDCRGSTHFYNFKHNALGTTTINLTINQQALMKMEYLETELFYFYLPWTGGVSDLTGQMYLLLHAV